jgi:hypothetical protein
MIHLNPPDSIMSEWKPGADFSWNPSHFGNSRWSDGFSLITSAQISHAMRPELHLSLGVLGFGSRTGSLQGIPFVGIDWEISQRLKLRTLNGAFLTWGIGRENQTLIDLGIEYRLRGFDIRNLRGTIVMSADSASSEQSVLVGSIGLRHEWKDVFRIRAFAEVSEPRSIESPLENVELKEAPSQQRSVVFGVEGGIRF